MAGPYSVECYTHKAAIGVPCDAHGTCCANRIARALFVNAGVVPPAVEAADRTAAIAPARAPAPVVGEDREAECPVEGGGMVGAWAKGGRA